MQIEYEEYNTIQSQSLTQMEHKQIMASARFSNHYGPKHKIRIEYKLSAF